MQSAHPSDRELFQICPSQLCTGHLIPCFCVFLPAAPSFAWLQEGSGEECCRGRDVCML